MRFLNKFSLLFSLLFLLFCAISLQAQFKPSKNYTTADGLPNNAVRSLFLDKNQELWIGTENGISKLENGIFSNLLLPKKITNKSCWGITQDTNGAMWFASYGGGVYKFDGQNFTVFNQKNGLPDDRTRKLLAYKNDIYVGTELGVALINIKTRKLTVPKGILPHSGVFMVSDFFVYKGISKNYFISSTIFFGFFFKK